MADFWSGLGNALGQVLNPNSSANTWLGNNVFDPLGKDISGALSSIGSGFQSSSPAPAKVDGPPAPSKPKVNVSTSSPQDSLMNQLSSQEAQLEKQIASEESNMDSGRGGGGFNVATTPPQTPSVNDYMTAFTTALQPYMNALNSANQAEVTDIQNEIPLVQQAYTTEGQNINSEIGALNTAATNTKAANTATEQGTAKQVQDLSTQQIGQNNQEAQDAKYLLGAQANGFGGPQAFTTNAQNASGQPYAVANQNVTTNTQDTLANLTNQLNQTNTGVDTNTSLQTAQLMGQLNQLPVEQQTALNGLQQNLDQFKQSIASGQISSEEGLMQMATQIQQFNQTYGLDYVKMLNQANEANAQIATTQRGQDITANTDLNSSLMSLFSATNPKIAGTYNTNQGQFAYDQYGNPIGNVAPSTPNILQQFMSLIGMGNNNVPQTVGGNTVLPTSPALPNLVNPLTGLPIGIGGNQLIASGQ